MIRIRTGQAPDPACDLSTEWVQTRRRIDEAQAAGRAYGLVQAVADLRAGWLQAVQPKLSRPRPK